jgi:hypothetical protein
MAGQHSGSFFRDQLSQPRAAGFFVASHGHEKTCCLPSLFFFSVAICLERSLTQAVQIRWLEQPKAVTCHGIL